MKEVFDLPSNMHKLEGYQGFDTIYEQKIYKRDS